MALGEGSTNYKKHSVRFGTAAIVHSPQEEVPVQIDVLGIGSAVPGKTVGV